MVVAGKAAVPVNASAVTIMGRSISPKAAFVGLAILGLAGIAFLYAFDPRNPGAISRVSIPRASPAATAPDAAPSAHCTCYSAPT